MKSFRWNYQYVQYILYLCIPLVLLLAIVLRLLFYIQADATLAIIQANERQSLHLARRTIDTVFGVLRGDALYLAEHSSLRQWLNTGDLSAQSDLAADFLAFARRRQLYDQVSFLDERGRAVVSINLSGGRPMITPPEESQDQSEFDYVQNTLAVGEDVVFISPFDLKIDRGIIEQPIKPTIHLSAPVFDNKNQKRGIVVLSYRGQRLLNRLRAISEQGSGNLWLLNMEGYWLIGPHPELEWGFMYPNRQTQRFDHEFGEEVWLSILRDTQSGQWMHEKGLFTYARVTPAESQNSISSEHWFLVSQLSSSIIAESTAEYTRNLVIVFFLLSILLVLLSGVIANFAVRRRQAENELRTSEAQFRGLLESAPDAIVIIDRRSCITLINSQTEKWFGYARDELLGQSVERLVPEQFFKEHPIALERYIAEPITPPMKAGVELFGRRKDGSEFPIEISLSPLETDQGLFITSIIRDISARKQAEEAQQRMQTQYRELINNLPIGIFRNRPNAKGRFLEVNQAMVDIFEAESTEQLLLHSFSESYCDLADRKAFINKVTCQGYVNGEEVQLKTLKEREFYAALTVVMKKDVAGEIYFDGIMEDISVRKENERKIQQLNDSLQTRSKELETINHELEAFSYSVSHDLRAPLRAIDGFSRTLLDEYADHLDDKGRDRLRRIRAAAQRMANLIDDLLMLSRVSRTELKWEVVDLTRLANEVFSMLQQMEPERTVQFSVQSGLIARGDARLLRVVMDNLLNNAWKFTAHCEAALILVGCNVNEEKIIYYVRDNGAGFDMAYADKLFGAFQRLHDANEFPGSGIGLATVQRVIHKHGGRIWAESAVNQGATFYFTLDDKESA